jgi:hypothetical protein
MKNTTVILLAILSFTSCNKKSDVNRKLIEDHFKYMNLHNLPAIKSQYADSASIQTYITPGEKIGRPGAEEVYHFLFFQFPNAQYRILDIMDNDTAAIVQYDVRGFVSVTMLKSGYGFRNCSIFRIKDGKIISEADYTGKQIN